MDPSRLAQLLAGIDQQNAKDPNRIVVDKVERPQELVYSERLTAWVLRLNPKASEYLKIASRGQHIRRWTIPRDRYPKTRAGYLRWRETLKTFHAETVAGLMKEQGCTAEEIDRVTALILKRPTADKSELQALEDALCLVFLETQLEDLKAKMADQKLQEVVRKSWGKMSEQGRQEALKLPLKDAQREWLAQAISSKT